MLKTLLIAAATTQSPDFESLHRTLNETTDVVMEECLRHPNSCSRESEMDLKLVEQLEQLYDK